ncbi:MAG TPA: tripartite tricarboxylate transporter substrate binding protein [Burkholderiales bacterium]|nr:tripartite tricarboxylate transporter substrate binding protein [Burkholderiales bacterium]
MRALATAAACAATALIGSSPVHAQTASAAGAYPAKPIRVIIAQAPGSATDVVTRIIINKLHEPLGQPLVVDARPGAGGTLGTDIAAKAPADGYNLFMANNSTHGSNPALYAKLPYDAVKDFAPIIFVAATPYVLTVHPSLPVSNVKHLIALAKARPGQLNYASAGNGSTHQLSGELLKSMSGIDMVHVPYKGTTPAIAALLSGEVSVMFTTASGILPHIKAGRAKGLAVTTSRRSSMLPGVPTVAETLPGFEMLSWFGLLAPAHTPPAIVTRLNAEMTRVLALPDVRAALTTQGFEVTGGTPEQFGEYIKREIAKITKIAKAANVKAE